MTVGYDSKKAEYNPNNNVDRKMLEEIIPKYNSQLLQDTIQECGAIMENIRKIIPTVPEKQRQDSTQIRPFTIKNNHGECAYYTMKFATPVIQYIPPAFKHLHFRFSNTFYNDVEYVPCYLLNINHVALLKMELSKDRPDVYDQIGAGLHSKFLFKGGKPMVLSSLNILHIGATKEHVANSRQEDVKKCFEFCYWHPPTPTNVKDSSCIHNLIYHNNNLILDGGVLQLRKTLLKIIKIQKEETLTILPRKKTLKCVRADVVLLVDDRKNLSSERRQLLLAEDVAGSFKEEDIINAIIITQNIKSPKRSVVIGSVGTAIKPGNVLPLLSLVLWKSLQNITEDSNTTKVGDIEEISNNVISTLQNNAVEESSIFYPLFMWESNAKKTIKKLIQDLFPLYLLEKNMIYHLPPTMLSFILALEPEVLSNKEVIRHIVLLLDLLQINAHKWGKNPHSMLEIPNIRNQNYTSPFLEILLQNSPMILNLSTLSRVFQTPINSHVF